MRSLRRIGPLPDMWQRRAQHKTVFDLVIPMTVLAGLNVPLTAALLHVPGVSAEQVHAWIKMRGHQLRDSVWVYIVPR